MSQSDKIVTLSNVLSILKKNISTIIISTILIGAAGTSYSMFVATPKYESSTQLIAKISSDNTSALAGQVQAANQMSTTLAQVLVSPTIIEEAKNNLNVHKSVQEIKNKLSVTASSTSQVVSMTVTDTNAYEASDLANEISKVFIKRAPELMNVSNVSILAQAQPNTTPTAPNKMLITLASIIAGFTIGVAISFIKSLFNTKIQSDSDLENLNINYLGGVSKIS